MTLSLVTIGVYGYDEAGFFDALVEAQVDTFCDIRARRGVRGKQYAFVNSIRLQNKLRELNIQYRYIKSLAPTQETRDIQKTQDKVARVLKRSRTQLSPSFIKNYRDKTLADFDVQAFVSELGSESEVIALFCVESSPEACHRSLVAEKLAEELQLEVRHIAHDRGIDRC